jgi:hypothetical protein
MKGYVLTFDGERAREVFAVCENLGFWPVGATWWFAWNELEIALSAPLTDPTPFFEDRWDVARVFAAEAELRLERWGRRRIVRLLVEEAAHHRLPEELRRSAEAEEKPFAVERGLRLLAGARLELPGGPTRGRVEYPRPLEYGVADDPDHPLVVAAYLYRDQEGGLRLVRYAELVRVPKDRRTVDIWRVRPYGIDGLEAIPGGE